MGITAYDWAVTAQVEALKFWFYAIAASILLTLYNMFFMPLSNKDWAISPAAYPKGGKTTSGGATPGPRSDHKQIKKSQGSGATSKTSMCLDLITDLSDLIIPGSAVGWIAADKITVGVAMALSSVIAGKRMWNKIQAQGQPL